MTYKIKPEFFHLWGEETDENTILDDSDLEMIARGWGVSVNSIISQLVPQCGYSLLYWFPGNPSWQELNDMIRFEDGNEEDFFSAEADFNEAVRTGFVKIGNICTTIWED